MTSEASARSLPEAVRRRAVELHRSGAAPAPTRDAATVVLLRDAAGGGVEAYLLRRVAGMSFAAGMYVFPGGSVEPRDAEGPVRWSGLPPAEWAPALTASPALAGALVCAAVRETFEECGVLLAGADESSVVAVDADAGHWQAERSALLAGTAAMSEVLARNGLRLRADLLRPWAHWVTPEVEPKRFDTRFFLAALPAEQRALHFAGESDVGEWLAPALAVERHAAGDMGMLPPTVFTLAELAEYGSVAEVLEAATAREVRRVLPKVVVTGEDVRLLLPGDPDYPHTTDGA